MKTSQKIGSVNGAAMNSILAGAITPSRMQTSARPAPTRWVWQKVKTFFVCSLALLSLGAVGSDGAYFPWPNLAGLIVFFFIACNSGQSRLHP
jgi:hypothetical protein